MSSSLQTYHVIDFGNPMRDDSWLGEANGSVFITALGSILILGIIIWISHFNSGIW